MSSQKKVSLTLTLRQVNCLRIAAGTILDNFADPEEKRLYFCTRAEIRAADAAYRKITEIIRENWAELYPTEGDN